jgi:peptide-methionine (R)-S-oxide reductase
MEKVRKTDEEWRRELTPEQYKILREKGTERPWSGEHNQTKGPGTFRCAGCGAEVFASDAKFESGSGWPSFYQPASGEAVATEDDTSFFMRRTEVLCATCGGHLGHVFPDGPHPTGLRYCINSCALDFEPAGSEAAGMRGGTAEGGWSNAAVPGDAPTPSPPGTDT